MHQSAEESRSVAGDQTLAGDVDFGNTVFTELVQSPVSYTLIRGDFACRPPLSP